MILSHARRILIVFVVLATAADVSFGVQQTPRPSYDPASPRPVEKPNSFVDFVSKGINPSDKNYGQCIDEGQKLVLEETVEHGYFWSNIVDLSLLGCLFVIIVYQHNRRIRREWIVAEVLQQYEHALARANARVDEATRRNHELAEELTASREGPLRSRLPLLESGDQRGSTANSKSGTESQPAAAPSKKSSPAITRAETATPVGRPAKPMGQIPLFKPEVDLIVRVNSLEQQLGRSQEQEKQLRRQLNQSELRLQTEQQRNRTLKGE